MKRKGVSLWTRFMQWYGSLDTLVQHGCLIVIIGVIMGLLLIALTVPFLPSPTTVYSATYRDCMEHETLTPYQCHQIALEAIDR